MSKGSVPRPYSVSPQDFASSFDRIFGKPQKLCGTCQKPVERCGCMPTDDGPGQDGAAPDPDETVYECAYAVDRHGNSHLISKKPVGQMKRWPDGEEKEK